VWSPLQGLLGTEAPGWREALLLLGLSALPGLVVAGSRRWSRTGPSSPAPLALGTSAERVEG
jgi:hypothetical protein